MIISVRPRGSDGAYLTMTFDHVDTCGEALFALHAHTTERVDAVAGSGGSKADSTDRSEDTVGGEHEIAGGSVLRTDILPNNLRTALVSLD